MVIDCQQEIIYVHKCTLCCQQIDSIVVIAVKLKKKGMIYLLYNFFTNHSKVLATFKKKNILRECSDFFCKTLQLPST